MTAIRGLLMAALSAVAAAGFVAQGHAQGKYPDHPVKVVVGFAAGGGTDPGAEDREVVLLLHGFPELAYSWRHQLPVIAAAGYHAIAPPSKRRSRHPARRDRPRHCCPRTVWCSHC